MMTDIVNIMKIVDKNMEQMNRLKIPLFDEMKNS